MPKLRVAHLIRDRALLETARAEAFRYVADLGQAPPLLRQFFEGGGWEKRFGLARVG